MKEIDFVGHFNKEWECLFENFYRPPAVAGTELKIYCKVPKNHNNHENKTSLEFITTQYDGKPTITNLTGLLSVFSFAVGHIT